MRYDIDLNCDVGEGALDEQKVMPYLSSCNIACAGHTGTFESVSATIRLAKQYDVKVGAHPSYDDEKNFGRVQLDWSRFRFRESVLQQLGLFTKAAELLNVPMNHIKMHGALYHAVAWQNDYADWFMELLAQYFPQTIVYGPPDSRLQQKCLEQGQPFLAEAFVDRRYNPDGTLVARSKKIAVITDVQTAVDQLISMVTSQEVKSVEETMVRIQAETFCVHGDNVELIDELPELINELQAHGIYTR
jgi:UPF0271 protein